MRKPIMILIMSIFLVVAVVVQASAWTTYSTGWGNPYYDSIKVLSAVNYDNNTSTQVDFLDTYIHFDNTSGTNTINCAHVQITEGNGTVPVDIRDFNFHVASGQYKIAHYYHSGSYSKSGYPGYVLVKAGGTYSGNCSLNWIGWDIFFYPGYISKLWRD